MIICFKCREREGIKRRSHAMRRDWYETREDPARTIYICCECYVPDPKAGRRTETTWEVSEAIWGEHAYDYIERDKDPSWGWDDPIQAARELERDGMFFA